MVLWNTVQLLYFINTHCITVAVVGWLWCSDRWLVAGFRIGALLFSRPVVPNSTQSMDKFYIFFIIWTNIQCHSLPITFYFLIYKHTVNILPVVNHF